MVDIKKRKCRTEGCEKGSSFRVAGTETAEYRAQHSPDGMVNAKSRKCRTEGCGKGPPFGVAGTKTAEDCAQHSPDGIVNVCRKMSRTESCKRASFEMASTKKAKSFALHALNEMADVRSRNCRTEGCGKQPSFGVAKTRTAEYCAQHARLKYDVEGCREREVDHHHSEKETIGNVLLPSGTKHQAVHSRHHKPSVGR